MQRIKSLFLSYFENIRKLGRLTPMAIGSMVLPMIGSYLIIILGYPLGNWLKQDQFTGSIVFFFGVLILCGFAVLATNVIGILGGWAFGFWLGLALLITAIVGAATIAFFINKRLTGKKLTDLTESNPRAKAIYNALVDEGFVRTLSIITLIRLSIVMPFAFTNFFLAAAKVPIGSYVIGTAVGMLPRAAATTFIGAGLSELVLEGVSDRKMLILGLAATVVTVIVISIISKRALIRLTHENLSKS